jgi:hypothetical protein
MTLILSGTDGLSDIDGSAATPAIRGTDANTGIFFGADIIGFAEGGAEVARFNADAQFVAAAGTALLPVITTTGDVNTGIFFPAADTIAFSEGGAEAMRIDSSGNVGIGTSSPQTRLHTFSSATTTTVSIQGSLSAGANTPTLDFTGDNGGYSFGARIQAIRDTSAGGYALAFGTTTNNAAESSAPTERMRIDSSGNLLVGTTSSPIANARFRAAKGTGDWSFGPHSGGDEFLIYNTNSNGVYLTNGGTSWTGNSDERIKDIIEPISNAVEKVCTLRAVIGKYKTDEDGIRRSFLIAQDVQAVLPEAVSVRRDELGTLGVQYTDTIPLLVAAIKEQQALITSLTARITALETP